MHAVVWPGRHRDTEVSYRETPACGAWYGGKESGFLDMRPRNLGDAGAVGFDPYRPGWLVLTKPWGPLRDARPADGAEEHKADIVVGLLLLGCAK